MLNGFKDFCQEFMTDVRVPDSDRIGDVDEGWTVGTRWMFHERMLHNSPYVTTVAGSSRPARDAACTSSTSPATAAALDDPMSRDLLGEAYMLELVERGVAALGSPRASRPARCRTRPASVGRLFTGIDAPCA